MLHCLFLGHYYYEWERHGPWPTSRTPPHLFSYYIIACPFACLNYILHDFGNETQHNISLPFPCPLPKHFVSAYFCVYFYLVVSWNIHKYNSFLVSALVFCDTSREEFKDAPNPNPRHLYKSFICKQFIFLFIFFYQTYWKSSLNRFFCPLKFKKSYCVYWWLLFGWWCICSRDVANPLQNVATFTRTKQFGFLVPA